MDEQRQRRHVERQPLGLARPVQKGFAAELLSFAAAAFGFFEALGVKDLPDERFTLLTGWVLSHPNRESARATNRNGRSAAVSSS